MESELKVLGVLEGKWLVVEVDGCWAKAKMHPLTDEEQEEVHKRADELEREARLAAEDSAEKAWEAEEEKARQAEADESERAREAVAAEPATVKRINLMAEVAGELNRAADEAAAYIEGVENYLEKMGFGVEVRGENFAHYGRGGKACCLEFAKVTGAHRKWCFVLIGHKNEASKSAEPLVSTPRVDRVLAARHVPALLEKMWERITAEAERIT